MCGSHDKTLKTKDHFIPKSIAKKYNIRTNIMLPCCSNCNSRRGNTIVFPPFENYSWMHGVSYNDKKKLINIFYHFVFSRMGANVHAKFMLHGRKIGQMEPIYYEWLDDYRKWVNGGYKPIDSKFNKKMYIIK